MTPKNAPSENSLRRARSSSVQFGNSAFGLRQSELFQGADSVAYLNFRMGSVKDFNQPRTSLERPYEILGNTTWPKEASGSLRCPSSNHEEGFMITVFGARALSEAEGKFARASGRGLSRVQKFIQDA